MTRRNLSPGKRGQRIGEKVGGTARTAADLRVVARSCPGRFSTKSRPCLQSSNKIAGNAEKIALDPLSLHSPQTLVTTMEETRATSTPLLVFS